LLKKEREKVKWCTLLYNCFIGFQKEFDSIKQEIILATFRLYRKGENLIQILQNSGERSVLAVRFGHEVGVCKNTGNETGRYIITNNLYHRLYLERVMDNIQREFQCRKKKSTT